MGIQVTIRNLHKVYQKGPERIHILRGLDLEIEAGERIAVLGVSGAGKSTLLHIIGTLDRPTEGQVTFDGVDVFAQSDRALAEWRNRRVGFVFQFHHLLEDFSAVENVAVPLLIRGERRRQALGMARDALDRVGLGERTDHLPAELSGGEQQRVAIARALVTRPQLLLMDEPTGNLDSATAASVHELIDDVACSSGATVVIVTHNEALAERMPRRLTLKDGRVSDE